MDATEARRCRGNTDFVEVVEAATEERRCRGVSNAVGVVGAAAVAAAVEAATEARRCRGDNVAAVAGGVAAGGVGSEGVAAGGVAAGGVAAGGVAAGGAAAGVAAAVMAAGAVAAPAAAGGGGAGAATAGAVAATAPSSASSSTSRGISNVGADIIRDARRDAASDMRRFGVIRTLGESGSGELPSAAVSASFEAERRRSGFFRTVAVESAGSAVFERPDVDVRRTTLRRTEPLRFESADEDRIRTLGGGKQRAVTRQMRPPQLSDSIQS